jgi:ubiquinone/menaquinone biosynthesis C-methylase UbiE
MLLEMSGVTPNDDVLDVACGPGLVACEFAPHARHVTGVDITPEMIRQAEERQKSKGLANLSWRVGDAAPLPFPDAQFSIVVTRYSFHHFLHPGAVLTQMLRVCKPGGVVMVVDVVLPPEKVDAYDHLEKLRDPSHVHALTYPEMAALIQASGLTEVRTAQYIIESEVEKQLAASFPNPGDADKVRALFEADLGHDNMGVGAYRRDGEIHFAFPILITMGIKPV